MYLISIGNWSSAGRASSWVLLVLSIRIHLAWSVENSHQCYSPIAGLLLAAPHTLVVDDLIFTARNLVAGIFVRIT